MRLAGGGKTVDRRASKARKLRFDVHQKIVNFMCPLTNSQIMEGRNFIVENLFLNKKSK